MKELVQPILALGGFGYLNYLVYSRIDNPDFGSDSDKKFIILLYSSMNYVLYLIVNSIIGIFINDEAFMITISILVTVSLSFLVTFTFPVLSALLFRLFNWIRNKRNLPDITNKTVSDIFFDKTSSFPMFIFSIPDGKLISKGYRGQKSGLHEDFSVINYNLYEEEPFFKLSEEKELMEFLEKEKIEADIYINFDKKIKIISFLLEEQERKVLEDEKL